MYRLIRPAVRFTWLKNHVKSSVLLILVLTPVVWTTIFIHQYGLTIPFHGGDCLQEGYLWIVS